MIWTKDTAQRREVGSSRNLPKSLRANSEPQLTGKTGHQWTRLLLTLNQIAQFCTYVLGVERYVNMLVSNVVVTPKSRGTWGVIYEQKFVKMAFHQELVRKIILWYLSEGRKLLLNTPPSLGTSSPIVWNGSKRSGNFSRVANSGLACMSVVSHSRTRMSIGTDLSQSQVTLENSPEWQLCRFTQEGHKSFKSDSRVTCEWHRIEIGVTYDRHMITGSRQASDWWLLTAHAHIYTVGGPTPLQTIHKTTDGLYRHPPFGGLCWPLWHIRTSLMCLYLIISTKHKTVINI